MSFFTCSAGGHLNAFSLIDDLFEVDFEFENVNAEKGH